MGDDSEPVAGQPAEQGRAVRVGIALTTDPSTTREHLGRFCRTLGAATGLDVRPREVWHYHHLLEGLEDGDIDLVWLPPILALRATAEGRVVPLVLPVRNGASFYQTALFSRRSSAIRLLADLRGVSAAWVDRQSAAGYLIIRAHLESEGVDLERAFRSDVFLGTHDGVAGAVLDGEVDVGATYVYFDAPDAAQPTPTRAGWQDAEVNIIAVSAPIPSDIVAAAKRLPEVVRTLVQQALLAGGEGELAEAAAALFDAEGFIAPTAAHLDPLTELVGGLRDVTGSHSLVPPPRPRRE